MPMPTNKPPIIENRLSCSPSDSQALVVNVLDSGRFLPPDIASRASAVCCSLPPTNHFSVSTNEKVDARNWFFRDWKVSKTESRLDQYIIFQLLGTTSMYLVPAHATWRIRLPKPAPHTNGWVFSANTICIFTIKAPYGAWFSII